MNNKPPCPYCGAAFSNQCPGEFMNGCPNDECPEHPRIHDPVGRPDLVEEEWNEIQQNAEIKKALKRAEVSQLQMLVDKYYQSKEQ
jgi:hypothetical protein